MKKVLIVLLLCASVLSCNQKQKNDAADTETATVSKKELARKLCGDWLSECYLSGVEKNKSILSSDYDGQLLQLRMEENSLLSDSAAMTGGTEHEGGFYRRIKYDEGGNKYVSVDDKTEFLYEPSEWDAPFEISVNKDNLLELYYPKTKNKILYRRIESSCAVDDSEDFYISNPMQVILREILFSGSYECDNKLVKFESNGSVSNFEDYHYYRVVSDFCEMPLCDIVIFFKTKDDMYMPVDGELYKYQLTSDGIQLQKINANWEKYEFDIDEKIIVLKKK